MTRAIAFFALLGLTACALQGNIDAAKLNPDNAGDPMKILGQVTITDADQAIARGTAYNIPEAVMCGNALKKIVVEVQASGAGIGPSAGILSAATQAVAVRQMLAGGGAASGVLSDLRIGCAPFAMMLIAMNLKDVAKPILSLMTGGVGGVLLP